MINKSRNKKHLSNILIVTAVLSLIISIVIICMKLDMDDRSQSAVGAAKSADTKDWISYSDEQIPFIFQYPPSLSFEKKIKDQKYPEPNTTYSLSGYTNDKKSTVIISYREGYDSVADHANECFEYRNTDKLYSIKISNGLTKDESIQVCGERKRWEYNYDGGKKEIVVVSYEGTDVSTFRSIVESLENR